MTPLLAVFLLFQQQMTPAEVIEKMEQTVSKIDDISLSFEADRVGTLFSPVSYLRDTVIKVRRDGHSVVEADLSDYWLLESAVHLKIAQSKDAFAARVAPYREEGRLDRLPPAFLCARGKIDAKSLATSDLFVMPNALPMRMFFDEPILHFQFAPKYYFSFEKNLKVVERRKVGGRDTIILGSRAEVRDPVRAMAIPLIASAAIEKFFYVDVETWLLERVILRFDLGRNVYGGVIVSHVTERAVTKNGVAIPTRTQYVVDTIDRSRWIVARPSLRKIRVIGVNTGLLPADFEIPPAEVEGDAILRPAKEAANDAAGRYNSAMSRLWVKRIALKLLGQKSTEEARAIEDLEKACELAPKCEFLARDLLAAYALYAPDKAIPFFEKAEFTSAEWKDHGAAIYLQRGNFDKAAGLSNNPFIKVDLALAKGDLEAAIAAAADPAERKNLAWRFENHWDKLIPILAKDLKNPRFAAAIVSCKPVKELVTAALDQFPKAPEVAKALMGTLRWASDEDAEWLAPLLPQGAERELLETVLLARQKKESKEKVASLLAKLERADIEPRCVWRLAAALQTSDPSAAGRACAAYFRLTAPPRTEGYDYFDTAGTPFGIAAELLKGGWSPGEFVRALAPLYPKEAGTSIPYMLRDALRKTGLIDETLASKFVSYAEKNPNDVDFAVLAARFLSRAEYDSPAIASMLDKMMAAGMDDPRIQAARALHGGGRLAVSVYQKLLKDGLLEKLTGEDRVTHLRRAAESAVKIGELDAAKEFLDRISWKDIPEDLELLTDLARIAMNAKAWPKAREFAHALADIGYMPWVLLGKIAEEDGRYDDAVRWYNRDIKEPGDPYESAESKKLRGAEAKKALLEKIGEDYFVKKLLQARHDPLSKEEESRLEEQLEALQSESLDARDKAEEAIRAFGPRGIPILKKGLDAADAEVRGRVMKVLKDWAEPK